MRSVYPQLINEITCIGIHDISWFRSALPLYKCETDALFCHVMSALPAGHCSVATRFETHAHRNCEGERLPVQLDNNNNINALSKLSLTSTMVLFSRPVLDTEVPLGFSSAESVNCRPLQMQSPLHFRCPRSLRGPRSIHMFTIIFSYSSSINPSVRPYCSVQLPSDGYKHLSVFVCFHRNLPAPILREVSNN